MKEFVEKLIGDPQTAQTIHDEHQRILGQYQARLRELEIDGAVQGAVAAAGGRNLRAIRALLDPAALDQAQDLQEAARAAVAAVKQESPYLFAAGRVFSEGTGRQTRPLSQEELGSMSLEEYRRFRKGRP